MKLIVKPTDGVPIEDLLVPEVKTSGSFGADVYIQKTAVKSYYFQQGLAVKIPLGIHAILTDDNETTTYPYLLVERSSTCLKKPITQANSIGVIDPDYRDELGWLVRSTLPIPAQTSWMDPENCNKINIERGERLCQIIPYGTNELIKSVQVVSEFPKQFQSTDRIGGMGSTGTK